MAILLSVAGFAGTVFEGFQASPNLWVVAVSLLVGGVGLERATRGRDVLGDG